jgi:hypothetical protein
VIIDNNLKWKDHISGSVVKHKPKTLTIRRLSNHIHINKLKEIADSIWVSKLRYGLPLYSEVRTNND